MRSTPSRGDLRLFGAGAFLTAASAVTRYTHVGPVVPFAVSAVALGVLAALVGRAVDRLGDRLGSGTTGAVHAALGNLPELFFGIFALRSGLVGVVQAALIGSILANVLLVLGLAFVVGGLRHGTQRFPAEHARNIVLLLVLAVAVLVIPSLTAHLNVAVAQHERALSDIASVVLLAVFVLSIPASLTERSPISVHEEQLAIAEATSDHLDPGSEHHGAGLGTAGGREPASAPGSAGTREATAALGSPDTARAPVSGGAKFPGGTSSPGSAASPGETGPAGAGDVVESVAHWSISMVIWVLLVSSVAAAFVSDWFVAALIPALSALHMSEAFAGLVVVAIAGNAVENVVGIQLAARNRADYAVSVILQSPVQIALVLIPALVLLSPVLGGTSLTLVLSPLLVVVLGLTAFVAVVVVFDGESTWLEGACLVGLYVVIATAFWWG